MRDRGGRCFGLVRRLCFIEKFDQIAFAADGTFQGNFQCLLLEE